MGYAEDKQFERKYGVTKAKFDQLVESRMKDIEDARKAEEEKRIARTDPVALAKVLKARVIKVYIAPVVDDFQDLFVVNVEFTTLESEKRPLYFPVYVGREERYKADISQDALANFEIEMIDEAAKNLAEWMLYAERYLAELRDGK